MHCSTEATFLHDRYCNKSKYAKKKKYGFLNMQLSNTYTDGSA
jgi:hypothetical protein